MSKFHNPDKIKVPRSFWAVLKWKLTSPKPPVWPKKVIYTKDIPPSRVNDDSIRISSVGHAAFLIQHQGKNILTDPVWSNRVGPFNIGIKRVADVGIDFDMLPKIDFVLVSHNHYDHLDVATLKMLEKRDKPVFIVPVGNEKTLKRPMPNSKTESLNWYNSIAFADFKIHLIPSQHWSSRTPFDINKALWGGFIIESSKTQICFIGDTGYDKKMFEEIGHRFNNISFAILPIGCYEPRWFMEDVHMNPREALQAFLDMKAKFIIPSHFGIFQLADDGYNQALEDYEQSLKDLNINSSHLLKPGEFILKSSDLF
ncbi:MBL fold metallo-hydrolase [Candidatus Phycorickettsia trachydisci]|nr:MBL fold metallo-hydrolase [Candidatus Phycorickettsia trachydisci]